MSTKRWRVVMDTTMGPRSRLVRADRLVNVAWGLEGIVEDVEAADPGCEVKTLTIVEEPA